MSRTHPFIFIATIWVIVSLACALPGAAPAAPDQNAVNTSIAQSISVRQTEAALANPPTATVTNTPVTPTATVTRTPEATFTSTLGPPMISVSVDTNCRVGPGSAYERVGILLAGQLVPITGREATGNYWYIPNPDQPGAYCWVWGQYGTVTGNIFQLLIIPHPTLPVTVSVTATGNVTPNSPTPPGPTSTSAPTNTSGPPPTATPTLEN